MPSGSKKRRATKRKKEIEAKINTKNVDISPNEVVNATSSSPVDGVSNIVGCEFAESVSNENERKSLTTNEEILVAQGLNNELEFLKGFTHVDDKVAQDKSGENEKYASFEEQVHVLDVPFQADSESEGTEKATGEIEGAAFGKEGVLEDDNSAKNVCKENDEAVFQDFTNELASKEADKFGTEGRNLVAVLDSAIDESLAVQSVPNEATQNYFGCPVHCNSDCSFYQLFGSQGKFESEERKFGSNIEQVERIKKTVEVELQVADKMRVILLKVLDDLTAIQQITRIKKHLNAAQHSTELAFCTAGQSNI